MTFSPDRAAFAYVGAFVEEMSRSGVRHVCVAPGSRSTPLALTIARHPTLRTWVHLDERVAAFFALGMARALGAPVALKTDTLRHAPVGDSLMPSSQRQHA